MPVWILNVAYSLMLVALAIRSILSLRIVLMTAQTIFIVYAAVNMIPILLFWNSVFLAINAVQVFILWRQRQPMEIPEDIRDLYDLHFTDMTPREFLYFWQMAKEELAEKRDVIIKAEEIQHRLLLILGGSAEVLAGRKVLTQLGRGHFIAEMSYLSGKGATADVRAVPGLSYVFWERKNIDAMKKLNPKLAGKLSSILASHMVEKIRETNRAQGEES